MYAAYIYIYKAALVCGKVSLARLVRFVVFVERKSRFCHWRLCDGFFLLLNGINLFSPLYVEPQLSRRTIFRKESEKTLSFLGFSIQKSVMHGRMAQASRQLNGTVFLHIRAYVSSTPDSA